MDCSNATSVSTRPAFAKRWIFMYDLSTSPRRSCRIPGAPAGCHVRLATWAKQSVFKMSYEHARTHARKHTRARTHTASVTARKCRLTCRPTLLARD